MAARYDSSSDWLEYASGPAGACTVAGVFRFLGGTRRIASAIALASHAPGANIGNSSIVGMIDSSGSIGGYVAGFVDLGFDVAIGEWWFSALTRDGDGGPSTVWRIYGATMTGALQQSSALSNGGWNLQGNRIQIGTNPYAAAGNEWLDGASGPLWVHSGVLSFNEIDELRRRLRPRSRPWLWAPGVHTGSARSNDFSGNGRHFAANGTIDDTAGPPIGWGAPILLVGRAAVGEPVEIDCETGTAVAAGIAASVSSPITIACNAGHSIAAGLAATITQPTTIACGIGQAAAHGAAAAVASPVTVACNAGQAVAAGLAAGVSNPVTIACEVGAAVAEGLQAQVSSGAAIPAQVGRAVAAGLPASVSSGAIVLADVGRAVAAGLPATIETVVSLSGWQKPAGKARKYRRVILGDRLYEVLERDIPALLEAELLDRAPPVTAEVIEGPKQPRKRAKKAPQPVKTVEQVRETVQQIKRRIEPDDAWLAQALEAVAFRVLERLQDEEDSLMLLLAA